MQIVFKPSGHKAWKDQETFAKPNLKVILLMVLGLVGSGFCCASILLLRFTGNNQSALPTVAPIVMEAETDVSYAVSIDTALPTFTPSQTPTQTHTPTITASPTIGYQATLEALQATNEALLSATPQIDVEATRQAIEAAYQQPTLVPTIAPVYEGYGTIIHGNTRIRSAPGIQYKVLGIEGSGSVFPVITRMNVGWTRIRMYDGQTGYVRSDLITFEPDENFIPTATATPQRIEASQ